MGKQQVYITCPSKDDYFPFALQNSSVTSHYEGGACLLYDITWLVSIFSDTLILMGPQVTAGKKADGVYLKESLHYTLQSSFLSSTLKLNLTMFLETFCLALLVIEKNRGGKEIGPK